jgi:hypothetical protein
VPRRIDLSFAPIAAADLQRYARPIAPQAAAFFAADVASAIVVQRSSIDRPSCTGRHRPWIRRRSRKTARRPSEGRRAHALRPPAAAFYEFSVSRSYSTPGTRSIPGRAY